MSASTCRSRLLAAACVALFLFPALVRGGAYVTETSAIRWNDVGGIRWNDVGGIRWNDVGGIRWNDVGGIRWNDVGGLLFTDAAGLAWYDVLGIRWNDVGSISFQSPAGTGPDSIDLDLIDAVSFLPDTSSIHVVITYHRQPTTTELDQLVQIGILGGTRFEALPMVVVNATKQQISQIAALPGVRSLWSDKTLSFFDQDSGGQIGLPELLADAELHAAGAPLTGQGVTIAVLDTGIDATHPDLPYGTKVTENVELTGLVPGIGFQAPASVEGLSDTDTVLGHGTFVASVAAGSGAGSNGLYAGIAPGASLVGLSAGDLFIVHVLEGFDYILQHASRLGIRVVNCSWGTQGWFDPDDPVNIATRMLYEAGIVTVFAAGNHGPSGDSLNPYAVAPWVIGVGSTDKQGRLSGFSSRGVFEELLYHPTLVAPGERIIAARAGAVSQVDGVVGIVDPTGGQTVPPPHDGLYAVSSGTSFAAPHVAATVALLFEADPSLGPDEVNRILQQTATPMLRRDRSERGAGRVDAWAAVALATDPTRPFGAHVPVWLDQRPYTLAYQAGQSEHDLPSGATVQIPFVLPASAVSWELTLAWGNVPGLSDLDVRVLDDGGVERARSETLNGHGLFGRVEGLRLLGDLPPTATLEVWFKPGTGLSGQKFYLLSETATPDLNGFDDLDSLSPSQLAVVERAVSRGLMNGRSAGTFAPLAAVTRGELARSLALAGGRPQRIPSSRSFDDVGKTDPGYAYVESVSGDRSTEDWIERHASRQFRPTRTVRRLDFAVAAVRAAGLGAEAEQRAGETLGLDDEASIPDRFKGYVAVALERGLIDNTAGAFAPSGKLTRLEAAGYLLELLRPTPTGAATGAGAPTPRGRPARGTRAPAGGSTLPLRSRDSPRSRTATR